MLEVNQISGQPKSGTRGTLWTTRSPRGRRALVVGWTTWKSYERRSCFNHEDLVTGNKKNMDCILLRGTGCLGDECISTSLPTPVPQSSITVYSTSGNCLRNPSQKQAANVRQNTTPMKTSGIIKYHYGERRLKMHWETLPISFGTHDGLLSLPAPSPFSAKILLKQLTELRDSQKAVEKESPNGGGGDG